MEEIESEGKTVGEAVDNALKKIGLRRDQVEVQILQESSSGFMGIGARPARVRLREKRWAPEPGVRRPQNQRPPETMASTPPVNAEAACSKAASILGEILGLMSVPDASLSSSWDGRQERVKISLQSPAAQQLVGSDGRPLESLQFLLTLLVGRELGAPVAVQIDALGYWEKKEKEILSQLTLGIAEVKGTGRPFRLAPMDPSMRRLIHRTISENPDVESSSEGEGAWRKIVLQPRKK